MGCSENSIFILHGGIEYSGQFNSRKAEILLGEENEKEIEKIVLRINEIISLLSYPKPEYKKFAESARVF